MFCPNCGNKMLDDDKFCAKCGWSENTKKAPLMKKPIIKEETKEKIKAKAKEKSKEFNTWLGTKDNKFYFIAIVLMLIPILLAIIGPTAAVDAERNLKYVDFGGILGGVINWGGNLIFGSRGKEHYIDMVKSPFRFNGFASILAVALYSIVLYRNKNTMKQFDKDKIEKKVVLLHSLNVVFLVTVCSLFTQASSIFGLNPIHFMIAATLLSIVSMKSLSGFCWIVAVVTALANLDIFNRWEGYSTIYVLSAYASMVVQFLVLNVFEFDFEQLKRDFMEPAKIIKSNVQESIETTKKGADKAFAAGKAAASIATGVPDIESIKKVTAKE